MPVTVSIAAGSQATSVDAGVVVFTRTNVRRSRSHQNSVDADTDELESHPLSLAKKAVAFSGLALRLQAIDPLAKLMQLLALRVTHASVVEATGASSARFTHSGSAVSVGEAARRAEGPARGVSGGCGLGGLGSAAVPPVHDA